MFDFTGTGPQVPLNLNTPPQVTFSAILYCLRCMVGHDVPLNQVQCCALREQNAHFFSLWSFSR